MFRAVAVLLASNYFAFQVELFEEEYEANHPQPAGTVAFGAPTLNWESFDKDNAPKAFVFDAGLRVEFLFVFRSSTVQVLPPHFPCEPVRDKSPPA